jgi:hypothetical protein
MELTNKIVDISKVIFCDFVGYLGITLNEMEKNTVELDKMTEI